MRTDRMAQATQLPRKRLPQRHMSREARSVMLAGFMEGCTYAEISETIFRATGEKIPTRTLCRRRRELLVAETRAETSRVFEPSETLASTRWRSEEIAELVAKVDRAPGSYARRRTQLWGALRLFTKDPGAEQLHELCELLLLFAFEREFDSSSLPAPAAPGEGN